MKNIETFLREGEKILRDKLNDNDDVRKEVNAIVKDQQKLVKERDRMRKKYLQMEEDRMKNRLTAERESSIRAREFEKQD